MYNGLPTICGMYCMLNKPFAIFVTGTDTDVGKTFICSALLRGLSLRGGKPVYWKPVQSGLLIPIR